MKKQRILVIFVLIIAFVLFYVNKTTTTYYCTLGKPLMTIGKQPTFTVTFNQILQTIYEMKHTDNIPKQDFYFKKLKNSKNRYWLASNTKKTKEINEKKYNEIWDKYKLQPFKNEDKNKITYYSSRGTYRVNNPDELRGSGLFWFMDLFWNPILKVEHEEKYKDLMFGKMEVKIDKSIIHFSNTYHYFAYKPIYLNQGQSSYAQPKEKPDYWRFLGETDTQKMKINRINGEIELYYDTSDINKKSYKLNPGGNPHNYSGKCSAKKEL